MRLVHHRDDPTSTANRLVSGYLLHFGSLNTKAPLKKVSCAFFLLFFLLGTMCRFTTDYLYIGPDIWCCRCCCPVCCYTAVVAAADAAVAVTCCCFEIVCRIAKVVAGSLNLIRLFYFSSSKHYLFLVYPLAILCRCLLYTSPSPRDKRQSRMPSSA